MFSVIFRTLVGGGGVVLPLCSGTVVIFYSLPSQLGKRQVEKIETNVSVGLIDTYILRHVEKIEINVSVGLIDTHILRHVEKIETNVSVGKINR